MLEQTPHQTNATALEEAVCMEVDRKDIAVLLQRKPLAGMDMLTVLGRQFHASQQLVRVRANRNPNNVIEGKSTLGERIADGVAKFGGSWSFIIAFAVTLIVYSVINVGLGRSAWDPYPFILLNLFLSMLAAIQAPVIMMSQNRQDTKDRLRGELDYDVNRRAEAEIQGLAHKLNSLGGKFWRSGRFASRQDRVAGLACGPSAINDDRVPRDQRCCGRGEEYDCASYVHWFADSVQGRDALDDIRVECRI